MTCDNAIPINVCNNLKFCYRVSKRTKREWRTKKNLRNSYQRFIIPRKWRRNISKLGMDVQSLIILHLLIPTDYGKIEMLHIQIYLGGMHNIMTSHNMQNPNLIGTEVLRPKNTTTARELTPRVLYSLTVKNHLKSNYPGWVRFYINTNENK